MELRPESTAEFGDFVGGNLRPLAGGGQGYGSSLAEHSTRVYRPEIPPGVVTELSSPADRAKFYAMFFLFL